MPTTNPITAHFAAVMVDLGLVEGQDYTLEALQTPVEMGTLYPEFASTMAKGVHTTGDPQSTPETTSLEFTCPDRQYDVYWYHPNYLGSVDLVTNKLGRVHQFFMYTAWGEAMYEYTAQSTTGSFDSPYRFNGKELDKETGYGYYGARYYQSKLSMWLSVDPLAHKYPSLSPYVFTGNNPILLLDPNGKEIYVTGEGAEAFIASLQSRTNMNLFWDQETGKVTFEGKAKGKSDKRLKAMSESKEVRADIVAVKNTDRIPGQDDGASMTGGAHMGTSFDCNQAYSRQVVNTAVLEGMTDLSGGDFDYVLHELYTVFFAGQSAFDADYSMEFNRNGDHYEKGKEVANKYAPEYPTDYIGRDRDIVGNQIIIFHPYKNQINEYLGGTISGLNGKKIESESKK